MNYSLVPYLVPFRVDIDNHLRRPECVVGNTDLEARERTVAVNRGNLSLVARNRHRRIHRYLPTRSLGVSVENFLKSGH